MAREGYLYELGMLVQLVQSHYFPEMLAFFRDYEGFLASSKGRIYVDSLRQAFQQEGRVIDAGSVPGDGRKLFTCANLAACCEIFGGWTIPAGNLDMAHTSEYLKMALERGGAGQPDLGRHMAVRLNNGDAVRVVQALKLLGLIAVDTTGCNQLSLGASIGRRDRHAFHLVPWIAPHQPGPEPAQGSPLKFGVKPHNPDSIVLMDSDPNLGPVYTKMSAEGAGRVQAMNLDIYDGLEKLSGFVKGGQVRPRNLVVAFRLAPQAFPDPGYFLDCLGGVIGETASFVTTIGAGDNVDEFRRRLQVLDGLEESLSDRGMEPVRIRYCHGKTAEERRNTPLFGLSQYASYETLFCKLERAKLAKL